MQGLKKSFNELEVLRGVDFEVARGSIFALLGSNGAGKTTVVKILSTLLKADAGTAGINGFDVATEPARVADKLATAAVIAGVVLYAISLPVALIGLVLRFRSSRGAERQQLRWVAAGAAAAAAGLMAGGAAPQQTVISSILYAMVLCIPLGVAVAVLRYRLWDLDRLVSRTVTYALVTALLVMPYLLILPVTARLARGSGSLAVAAATLIAAAAFQPLRRRVQDLVDRRFNRRRYDTARTLERFAARLRDQLDLDALEGELLGVVDQTVAPTRASLWLRPPANSSPPT